MLHVFNILLTDLLNILCNTYMMIDFQYNT